MINSKVVVSSIGTEVSSSDNLNKNFDSSSLTHKIYDNILSTIILPSSGTIATVTIPHNLGHPVVFQVFAELPSLGWSTIPGIFGLYQYTASGFIPIFDTAIDSNNVYIKGQLLGGSSSNLTVNLRCIIFTDKI